MRKVKAGTNEKSIPKATNVEDVERFVCADHPDPFAVLGMHVVEGGADLVVRVWRPGAQRMMLLPAEAPSVSQEYEMTRVHPAGFFELLIPEATAKFAYRLKWKTVEGHEEGPVADPYAFGTLLGEQDLHYLGEGKHRQLFEVFGAHRREMDGVEGMMFVVWAPNAGRVSVVGDFNAWDGRVHVMRKRLEGGVWELFVPGVGFGAHYKFELVGADGSLFNKSDPFAFFSQHGTGTASITHDLDVFEWSDVEWMERRTKTDLYRRPVSIYEVHLGSWARVPEEGDRFLTYRELADRLVNHVLALGFTHIELMPVAEFPFDGSWGYQGCGFFAPTSRFGSPDDFRYFVNRCHQCGIGLILDWVPAHFPKDPHGLVRFDGTALYEHDDPRLGEHMDWGTLIFNFGREEVRNFLISNALFWLDQYHIDGLRVDAVASMLYLDYSREEGQWLPNEQGGRENLGAIAFLKEMNSVCYDRFPGIMTIAEESTAFPGVSRPVDQGGLGFGFKWNMGWMHDCLQYMGRDPVHRKHHHGEATFPMIYAYDENFFLVLSHDEAVHGKKSLLGKMPGDRWQQFANLRLFFAWMYAHPGKKLLFQGSEIAPSTEWNYNQSLDWHLLEHSEHAGVRNLVEDLNRLYKNEPALHQKDHQPDGFEWIDYEDSENSSFSFVRRSDEGSEIVVVVNATPVPRSGFRVGVPGEGGDFQDMLNILQRRAPWVRILIHPVPVQGSGAEQKIARAIEELSQPKNFGLPSIDTIVVTRGGGSIEDLWNFNEECVARAIARCPTPLVSAVGHEIDFTIADFVADLRAPTPSAAAELVVPDASELRRRAQNQFKALETSLHARMDQARTMLRLTQRTLDAREPGRVLMSHAQHLDHLSERFTLAIRHHLNEYRGRLEQARQALQVQQLGQKLSNESDRLSTLNRRLNTAATHRLEFTQSSLARLQAALRQLSPEATFSRGFSMTTTAKGEIITDPGQTQSGDTIKTRVARGKIVSTVDPAQ